MYFYLFVILHSFFFSGAVETYFQTKYKEHQAEIKDPEKYENSRMKKKYRARKDRVCILLQSLIRLLASTLIKTTTMSYRKEGNLKSIPHGFMVERNQDRSSLHLCN